MNREGKYYDVHSHILPGVDDGAADMEETTRMLQTAISQGIHCIIATPHYAVGADNVAARQLEEIRGQVQEEANKLDKAFTIYLGNELYYSESIIEALKEGKALTLAKSRYVLVEFSVKEEYRYLYQGLGQLLRAGYAPILAHVERYLCLSKKKDRLMELIEQGCYLQMNSSSLIGGIFDTEAAYNRKLFEQGMIHLVGSDSHDSRVRIPRMISAVEALKKKCDEELIRKVFLDNPVKIIKNVYI